MSLRLRDPDRTVTRNPVPGALARLARPLRRAGFLRGEGPTTGPVALDRSRIFVLPTRAGWTLGVLLLAMLLGSVNYENSLGLLLTFLLGSLAVVSILHTHRNLSGLRLAPGRTEPVFAGEAARFAILLDNPGGTRRAVALRPRGQSAPGEGVAADLAPGTSAVELLRPAARRGRLALGPVVVETRFPLGLARAWSVLELELACLVYPRPGPPHPWPAPTGAYREGEAASPSGVGQGDFAGIRRHHPGESPGTVHWKASARAQELLSKHFLGEQGAQLWLTWDELPGLGTEDRLSRLCRWALEAHGSARPWALRLPGFEAGPDRGEAHLRWCLTALAEFEP